MKLIKNLVAGILIGISNVIPGISGGTMAVLFNVYDQIIEALSLNFKFIKQNFWMLFLILIGIIAGIVGFSHIMNYLLATYPNQTYGGFVGVILGSLPLLLKVGKLEKVDAKAIFAFVLFLSVMVILWLMQDHQRLLVDVSQLTTTKAVALFLAASIATFTMVIPGVSGSMILVMIGYYHAIFIYTIRELVFPHLIIVISGMIFGLILGAKLISFLLKRFKDLVYASIFGLILGSLLPLLPSLEQPVSTLGTLVAMALITYYFEKLTAKKNSG
ncbi:MAG: DUF368 domain-containing protein [Erysipelothrix sp.]|jgi:putative membrane protein|nr:DUF368 domain-containing protein [Erysipelothrix sp.]